MNWKGQNHFSWTELIVSRGSSALLSNSLVSDSSMLRGLRKRFERMQNETFRERGKDFETPNGSVLGSFSYSLVGSGSPAAVALAATAVTFARNSPLKTNGRHVIPLLFAVRVCTCQQYDTQNLNTNGRRKIPRVFALSLCTCQQHETQDLTKDERSARNSASVRGQGVYLSAIRDAEVGRTSLRCVKT